MDDPTFFVATLGILWLAMGWGGYYLLVVRPSARTRHLPRVVEEAALNRAAVTHTRIILRMGGKLIEPPRPVIYDRTLTVITTSPQIH